MQYPCFMDRHCAHCKSRWDGTASASPQNSRKLWLASRARILYSCGMSKAESLFNVMPQLRGGKPPRKVLSAARNAARQCSVDELSEFYQQRAYKDAIWLMEIGCPLRDAEASPTVHQGGSDESSRPKASEGDSVGAEQSSSLRSEGTPSIAKSKGDADTTIRSSGESASPSDSPLNFF